MPRGLWPRNDSTDEADKAGNLTTERYPKLLKKNYLELMKFEPCGTVIA